MSKSTVSRVCAAIKDEFKAFKARDLSDVELARAGQGCAIASGLISLVSHQDLRRHPRKAIGWRSSARSFAIACYEPSLPLTARHHPSSFGAPWPRSTLSLTIPHERAPQQGRVNLVTAS